MTASEEDSKKFIKSNVLTVAQLAQATASNHWSQW